MMKIIHVSVLPVLLAVSTGLVQAKPVSVYCKNGTLVRGSILAITKEAIVIDPDGPTTYRRIETAVVDSVVTDDPSGRRLYPTAEELPGLDEIGSLHGSRVTRRFALGVFAGYRLVRELERERVVTEDGDWVVVSLEMDGSVLGGMTLEYQIPSFDKKSYVILFTDMGLAGETFSIRVPGARAQILDLNYIFWDVGLKPMVPILKGGPALYISPFGAIGFLATNIQSTGHTYGYYPYRNRFDASFLLQYGASLDVVSRRNVQFELSARANHSPFFLERAAFTAWEVRFAFKYATVD